MFGKVLYTFYGDIDFFYIFPSSLIIARGKKYWKIIIHYREKTICTWLIMARKTRVSTSRLKYIQHIIQIYSILRYYPFNSHESGKITFCFPFSNRERTYLCYLLITSSQNYETAKLRAAHDNNKFAVTFRHNSQSAIRNILHYLFFHARNIISERGRINWQLLSLF